MLSLDHEEPSGFMKFIPVKRLNMVTTIAQSFPIKISNKLFVYGT